MGKSLSLLLRESQEHHLVTICEILKHLYTVCPLTLDITSHLKSIISLLVMRKEGEY